LQRLRQADRGCIGVHLPSVLPRFGPTCGWIVPFLTVADEAKVVGVLKDASTLISRGTPRARDQVRQNLARGWQDILSQFYCALPQADGPDTVRSRLCEALRGLSIFADGHSMPTGFVESLRSTADEMTVHPLADFFAGVRVGIDAIALNDREFHRSHDGVLWNADSLRGTGEIPAPSEAIFYSSRIGAARATPYARRVALAKWIRASGDRDERRNRRYRDRWVRALQNWVTVIRPGVRGRAGGKRIMDCLDKLCDSAGDEARRYATMALELWPPAVQRPKELVRMGVALQLFKVSRTTLKRDRSLTDYRPERAPANAERIFSVAELATRYQRRSS
jgi:hypothetical protein